MIPTLRIRSIWTWVVLTVVPLALLAVPARRTPGDIQRREMEHGGRQRTYLLYRPKHAPADKRLPLVLAFHGGGGSAGQMLRYSGLNRLADRHHFIVVYPDAIDKHWNDGRASRKFLEHDRTIDDIAWIKALVKKLLHEEPVDRNRVFAVGVSNGGFFCQRLAVEMTDQFAAVASIISSLPEKLAQAKPKPHPISVLLMNGTSDPLVPYEGGEVSIRSLLPPRARRLPLPSRGRCLSTDRTIEYWKRHNAITSQPKVSILPNRDPEDGCRIERKEWIGKNGARVVLYKIMGGGHGLPGRSQYLPKDRIGNICQDIDGMEEVWEFFRACNKT